MRSLDRRVHACDERLPARQLDDRRIITDTTRALSPTSDHPTNGVELRARTETDGVTHRSSPKAGISTSTGYRLGRTSKVQASRSSLMTSSRMVPRTPVPPPDGTRSAARPCVQAETAP